VLTIPPMPLLLASIFKFPNNVNDLPDEALFNNKRPSPVIFKFPLIVTVSNLSLPPVFITKLPILVNPVVIAL
jgi:hypothetical protein